MGKWVSIYFKDAEYAKLEKILEKERKIRGRKISAYELVKRWVVDRLNRLNGEKD